MTPTARVPCVFWSVEPVLLIVDVYLPLNCVKRWASIIVFCGSQHVVVCSSIAYPGPDLIVDMAALHVGRWYPIRVQGGGNSGNDDIFSVQAMLRMTRLERIDSETPHIRKQLRPAILHTSQFRLAT